ncbi:hypothetical protein ACFOUP_09515 [Belliella kenyensis]|uniref:Uncharacterized protein n=1 Tax=Belliella kenyensis TaxID=1472724 RepID=A0ABV8ELC0_9BACT|nr:hypothetical protein [Belliella kenyensis]MCH7402946.1 hypothetical protein [Belliella kenyensis]MDN3604982.1 hypothetical protein [Belliella kenyensis]
MGFIPVILTMSGAIMLFIMVVKQSITQKRNNVELLIRQVAQDWNALTNQELKFPTSLDNLSLLIKKNKSQLQNDQLLKYDKTIKSNLFQAKLLRVQHNKLISTRPYSFVAKLFGYKAI